MAKILSTVADYFGTVNKQAVKSANEQEDFLDKFNNLYSSFLDKISEANLPLRSYPFRPLKGSMETVDEFVSRLTRTGGLVLINEKAAHSLIDQFANQTFTVANDIAQSAVFTVVTPPSEKVIFSSIQVILETGSGVDTDRPSSTFRCGLLFKYMDRFYLNPFLIASTSNITLTDYYSFVFPIVGSIDDPQVFFQTLLANQYRSNNYNVEGDSRWFGAMRRIVDEMDLYVPDSELASTPYAVLFTRKFGRDYLLSDVIAFVTKFCLQYSTAFCNLATFAEGLAESRAINVIHSAITATLTAGKNIVGNVSNYLSNIKTRSIAISNYVSQLSSMTTGSDLEFACKFSSSLNSSAAEADADDPALLVYKDRNTGAPANFLTGVVGPAIGSAFVAVGAAIALIGGTIGKVFGLITSGIGLIVRSVNQAAKDSSLATPKADATIGCIPVYEFDFNNNMAISDFAWSHELLSNGYVILNTAFMTLICFKKADGTHFRAILCVKPVDPDYLYRFANYIHDEGAIIQTSAEHWRMASYSKAVALREWLATAEDTNWQDSSSLDGETYDRWLRIQCATSILLARFFILLFQREQFTLAPYGLSTTAQWGGSSVQGDSLLHFFYAAYDENQGINVLRNRTPSWREMFGLDALSYSAYPDLFRPIQLSDIPWFGTVAQEGKFSDHEGDILGYIFSSVANDQWRAGDVLPTPGYTIPAFDPFSLFLTALVAAAVTAVTATVAVVGSLKIKKFRRTSAAIHASEAEAAWQAYCDDPTSSNYTAYRKAVRKNNCASLWNGGDKLSSSSYWSDASSGDDTGSPASSDNTETLSGDYTVIKKLIDGVESDS